MIKKENIYALQMSVFGEIHCIPPQKVRQVKRFLFLIQRLLRVWKVVEVFLGRI